MRLPLACTAALLLLLPATAAAEVPSDADWSEDYIVTPGQPTLHVDVLKPKGAEPGTKLPAIVSVGPYFGHSGSPDAPNPTAQGPVLRWQDLIEGAKIFQRGYALVQVDLRGFGGSAGCNDFGGPGEQTDVKRAVEWTTSQPWSTGKAALYGKSYDGWTGVMGLSEKPKGLAAAIIQSPIIDGYRTLFNHGVHYDSGWYATPGLYQGYDAMPPSAFDSPQYFVGSATGTNPACYAQNVAQQTASVDHDDPTGFWAARDLPKARGASIPVLWSHGFNDANTKPDNFLPVYTTLTGPKRVWTGQYAHDRGNEVDKVGHDGFFEDVMAWLDRYVKGDPTAHPNTEPSAEVGEGDGRWRYEAQFPPADVVVHRMAVNAGAFTDAPSGTFGDGDATWSITEPLPYAARVSGTPMLEVEASSPSPRAHLIAQVFDIDETLKATVMHRAAHVVEGNAGKFRFDLFPNDYTLPAGHRIGLRLTADDPDWFTPPNSAAPVTVAGGTLELPFLTYIRDRFLESNETPSMRTRSSLQLSEADVAAAKTAFELPQALVTRPPGTEQGAAKPRPGARRPANRLRIRGKALKGRRLRLVIRGSGTAKVRLVVKRGKRVVFRRTLRSRRGRAVVTVKLGRKGRYRVRARVLGGLRLRGSRVIRVR
jgi:predicted acyl esterase